MSRLAPTWGRAPVLIASDLIATVVLIGLLEAAITVRMLAVALVASIALASVGANASSWRRDLPLSARASRLLFASVTSLWLGVMLASAFRPAGSTPRLIAATVGLPVMWLLTRALVDVWFRPQPVRLVVVGPAADVADFLSGTFVEGRAPYEVVGYVDDSSVKRPGLAARYLGEMADLAKILSRDSAERVVIVGLPALSADALLGINHACDLAGIELDIAAPVLEGASAQARVSLHKGIPLLRVRHRRAATWQHAVKRSIDVLGAGAALVLLAPVLCLISLVTLISQGRPVLFRQVRVGRHGHDFEILKYRTLATETAHRTQLYMDGFEAGDLSISEAVTGIKIAAQTKMNPLGAFLRKTSLDELPQLWNVVRGDMSLVGPRPLRRFEHDALEPWLAAQRAQVRPGITGLWQVSGRDDVDWDERVNLDYSHVRDWGLARDIEILIETIPAVIRRR